MLPRGKHKVGANGDDDLSETFCRHINISGEGWLVAKRSQRCCLKSVPAPLWEEEGGQCTSLSVIFTEK